MSIYTCLRFETLPCSMQVCAHHATSAHTEAGSTITKPRHSATAGNTKSCTPDESKLCAFTAHLGHALIRHNVRTTCQETLASIHNHCTPQALLTAAAPLVVTTNGTQCMQHVSSLAASLLPQPLPPHERDLTIPKLALTGQSWFLQAPCQQSAPQHSRPVSCAKQRSACRKASVSMLDATPLAALSQTCQNLACRNSRPGAVPDPTQSMASHHTYSCMRSTMHGTCTSCANKHISARKHTEKQCLKVRSFAFFKLYCPSLQKGPTALPSRL